MTNDFSRFLAVTMMVIAPASDKSKIKSANKRKEDQMNNDFFVIADVLPGKLNALVKNIMKQTGINNPNEAVRMVNAGEVQILIKPKWIEENGLICFSVTSDGTAGKEWIPRLEAKGLQIDEPDKVKSVLYSQDFKPTSDMTYEVVVLRGRDWEDDDVITTESIREKAKYYKLSTPDAEVACLIGRDYFDKQLEAMGLSWFAVMHEPIKDFKSNPRLLGVSRRGADFSLRTDLDLPGYQWEHDGGFAFIKPKWTEENGVICFSVTSDGTTGKEWIARLESKGLQVAGHAKKILKSENFNPGEPGTYEITLLKGMIWSDNERIDKNISKYAWERGLATPNIEIACLIREKFSDNEIEAMGLKWIVIMHEPIKDTGGDPILLEVYRRHDVSWLGSSCIYPWSELDSSHGFAFVSKVSVS